MIRGIDHVVIFVRDLDAAITTYTALGFTVVPGGQHADGKSHNALVTFADGSYLELFAFIGQPVITHPFYREGVEEGLITFALLPDDIQQTVKDARERGLQMGDPRNGGRQRPDGVRVDWQTSQAPSRDLPFLCYDVTARDLRVPGGDAHKHANGAVGIQRLGIAVADIAVSRQRYTALLGSGLAMGNVHPPGGTLRTAFQLASTALVLVQPTTDASIKAYMQSHGEGPYRMDVRVEGAGAKHGQLDPEATCGVMLKFIEAAGK